ncbi:MAG: hypothetical protein ACI8Y7_001193 [Candidatus Woesearchaeota archaeon]|jgi:hypothetical protein
MSFMDKLKFWKKEDPVARIHADLNKPAAAIHTDSSFDTAPSLDTQSGFNSQSFGTPSAQPSFGATDPSYSGLGSPSSDLTGLDTPTFGSQTGVDTSDFNAQSGFGTQVGAKPAGFDAAANPPDSFSTNHTPATYVPPASEQKNQFSSRDVELILSRLDLIKTQLENVSHRLDKIENGPQKGW